MAELLPLSLSIYYAQGLSFFDRLSFSIHNRVKLIDHENIPELMEVIDKNGFGYIRGKLPRKYAYIDHDSNREYVDSRNIMLRVSID